MIGAKTQRAAAIGLTALLLPLAACGSRNEQTAGHAKTASASPSGRAIEVVYDGKEQSSDGPLRIHMDVLLAGNDGARVSLRQTGMAPMLFVWDGVRLLVRQPEGARPWSLYEAADEHQDQLQMVTQWRLRPGTTAFEQACRAPRVVGHRTLLGRRAVGYHCASRHNADGSSEGALVIWVDEPSGLMLRLGGLHATSIDESPTVTGDTFSTDPPAGARVQVYAAKKPFQGAARPPRTSD